MLRGLRYYWRIQVAVAGAVAVCGAVITGALLVGDSIRASLRDLTLDRLAHIDVALVAERFFAADLADRLAGAPGFDERFDAAAPAIVLRGSAQNAESRARASGVSVLGIDERFMGLYDSPPSTSTFQRAAGSGRHRLDFSREARQTFATAVINEALSRELGAAPGDTVLLYFRLGAEVPRDTLLGERDTADVVGSVRVVIGEVIPDRGMGRFDLSPQQSSPLLAYLDLQDLQRAVEQPGRANALFVSRRDDGGRSPDLDAPLDLTDMGLTLRQLQPSDRRRGAIELRSDRLVLDPAVVDAARRAADDVGAAALPLQAYVVNEISLGDRSVPYSMVMALEGAAAMPFDAASEAGGLSSLDLDTGGVLLNEWTATELAAQPGDRVTMRYYVVGADEALRTESREFRVAGIVPMRGLAVDPDLMPPYPGIEDADDISMWDPPFPVDLGAIRPQDEAYWDEWRGAPKAFVAAGDGVALWSTRYGAITALRITHPAGIDLPQLQRSFGAALRTRLSPAQFGYTFLDVKRQGLDAAAGATDFGGLFIGFSLFIIVAAALIVSLLFSLGIEQRAREIGLLRALGFPLPSVRRRLVLEGAAVAIVGAIAGLGGAVLYARLMLLGLTTIWLPAVGSPLLFLHVRAGALAAGFAAAVVVALLTMTATLRRLGRVSPPRLLSGSFLAASEAVARRTRRAAAVSVISGSLAALLLGWSLLAGESASPAAAFGAGALLLVCGLAAFSSWCRDSRGRVVSSPHLTMAMAARNSGWNPRRSQLSVALVASACFVIVAVAGNVRDPASEQAVVEEGAGGYHLIATADVPLHENLGSAAGLFELGLDDQALSGMRVQQLRLLPGDDASCLNLYRPQRPRLLGVPPGMVQERGFQFAGTALQSPDPDNPWSLLEVDLGPDVVPAIGDANSVQWILHLGLGDDLALNDERGRSVSLRIVGTLRESVFQSELLISESNFLRLFPSRSGFSYFLLDAPAERLDEVGEVLEAGLGRYGFDVTPSAHKLAGFLVVQNTYLATFQLLGGLGLLLGTIGLAIVLVRSVVERRGELATLRAFGFSLRFLGRLVLAESAFLLLLGTAIGTMAALLAISPRYLLGAARVPWSSLLPTLAAVLLVGMSASAVAVASALRSPLLQALKQER